MEAFGLPNLQSRMPMHAGQGPGLSVRELGETGGSESVTLTVANMPAHNHQISVKSDGGNSNSPTNNYSAADNTAGAMPYASKADSTMMANAVSMVGGSQPVGTESPFQVINFIICLEGIYPSRD